MTVLASSVGASFSSTVTHGSLVLSLPVAAIAGLVSFLSPCVLPLVPGYVSYITGLSGAELAAGEDARSDRRRLLLGSGLFVLGFSLVYLLEGVAFLSVTQSFYANGGVISRVLGGVTIVLGIGFLGYVPALSREWRVHRRPRAGIVGAPLLGVAFGIGWAPCSGPTLGAVIAIGYTGGTGPTRSAVLIAAYCLGLGVPFVAVALGLRRALGAVSFMRKHSQAVMRFGGALLIIVGLLLLTGWWGSLVAILQRHTPSVGLV